MNKIDIQVGDRITYNSGKSERQVIMTNEEQIENYRKSNLILKIERPKYEVIEENRELLTEEEKEFLKMYIKIIENLNNGKVKSINRNKMTLTLYLETGLSYYIEVGPKFSNMKLNTTYTLEELGLE